MCWAAIILYQYALSLDKGCDKFESCHIICTSFNMLCTLIPGGGATAYWKVVSDTRMAPRDVAWEVILGRETRVFFAMAAARESVPSVSMARRWMGLGPVVVCLV